MPDQREIERLLSLVVDPPWYRGRHRDVTASGADPLRHFIESGLRERRDPNRWFDGAWYANRYPDVAASGAHPLLHYMTEGAAQKRDPHPRFDAGWYVDQHPEAAANPLLFHLRIGAARGWLTERPVTIEDWLPSACAPFADPLDGAVDVIVPVYRGLAVTRRCIESVLADAQRPPGRIIVIDDCSPEPKLHTWLDRMAKTGAIVLLRNKTNLGFVASCNLGMRRAGRNDIVLLNSDTEVPSGWLRRLRAQAYAAKKIASVSPLSNNASICGFFEYAGGPMPAGVSPNALDAACQAVNAGRFAETPTTVGFCMYMTRAALDDVGPFDVKTFGKGYGEENDFCLRAAARGWSHRIACDTFVYHEGNASFGAAADPATARAYGVLTRRYPDYATCIAQFVEDDPTAPYRFAAAMALFRRSGLPTMLLLSHDMDGGVRRSVHDGIARDADTAHALVLEPAARGVALSVPNMPGLPKLVLAPERSRDLAAVARSAGVTRVHIHHLMGIELDARALIHDLAVPFDVTAHDYFAFCPQVTLLPRPTGLFCGEPGPAGCDACIANRPSHGATDILSWRLTRAWQFNEAERVFAPSRDTLDRLRRFGVGENATLQPHDPVLDAAWPLRLPARPGLRLRVAVLGVLASHKGAHSVAAAAIAADPARLRIQVIGPIESPMSDAARARLTIHGPYREGELPALLAKYRPHAIWFPASWPETYSYTLSAAIDSGLPIVASEIGAFPERLAGRPMTWVTPPTLDPAVWLALFESVGEALRVRAPTPTGPRRQPTPTVPSPAPHELREGLIDLRHAGGEAVLVVPEQFDDGSFTPCAHIRLLRPLDHPGGGRGLKATVSDAAEALRYHADIILTQRHAVTSSAAAEALAAHARRTDATLIYDLDDDLLTIPPDHPEAADLKPRAALVEQMVRLADLTRVSTAALADRIALLARRIEIRPNALDERIWLSDQPRRRDPFGPVRILCMGTTTHDADFALLLPALRELHRQFPDQIQIDLIGFVASAEVPGWIQRMAPSRNAARSYPGFVHWITRGGPWDIGLAPLVDSPFNACKSPIKAMDYAALGLATLASDVAAYRGSVADGPGGRLVTNTTTAWFEAVSRMVRDVAFRHACAEGGAAWLRAHGTLAATAGSGIALARPRGPTVASRRRRTPEAK